VFLCRDEFEAGFFVRINNTGGPVDVWMVTGIEADELVDGGSGFGHFPSPVPPAQVTLADWPRDEAVPASRGGQHGKKKQNRKNPRAGK
jgi:hypothetical protein